MLLEQERVLVVKYCQKLVEEKLIKGTSGNISIFNAEEKLMAISPSGINYSFMDPSDIVVMNLKEQIVDGAQNPSSEFRMHLIYYLNREGIKAVVHTHSPFATTIACLNWDLPAIHYTIAFAGTKVPCARYVTFGTEALAKNTYETMGTHHAVLLANHGLLTVGSDLGKAFTIAQEIEFVAELYYRSKSIGEPVIIPDEEMQLMVSKFKEYGSNKG